MAINLLYYKNDKLLSNCFIPSCNFTYKKVENNIPIQDTITGNVITPTSNPSFDFLKPYNEIYEINITTINNKSLVDMLIDYTKSYSDNIYITITDGNISFKAYLNIYNIDDDKIQMKFISLNPNLGIPLETNDNVIFELTSKTKLPQAIRFYRYGNYIIVDCENKELITIDEYNKYVKYNESVIEYNKKVDNESKKKKLINLSKYIPISSDDAISIKKYNRSIILEFIPSDQFKLIQINVGKSKATFYTNLPKIFTDIVIQKIGHMLYKLDFRLDKSAKNLSSYFEIYKVDNDNNEILVSKIIGNSTKICLDEGFYRIYQKVYLGTFDFTVSDYTELKIIDNKFVLQFNTSTIIEPYEYVEITSFDDCVIEIYGNDDYVINSLETKKIYFYKPGKYTCNVYSKTLNNYVGSFIVQCLDKHINTSFIDIEFDEELVYGKPLIARINAVNLDVDELDISLSGDIEVIEKINNSEFIIKFTKIRDASINVIDNISNGILLSKVYNISIGSFDFDIDVSDDGFYITSPFDCFVISDHFTKYVQKNSTVFIECFTTGKFRFNIEFLLGQKSITKKYIIELHCENGFLYNPYNRTVVFLHPNIHEIVDYEWYVNGNLYMLGTNKININENFDNNVDITVVYYINGKKYQHDENITLKPITTLSCNIPVLSNNHNNQIIINGIPILSLRGIGISEPKMKFTYIDREFEIRFDNFYYLGNDTFVLDNLDNLKIDEL